MNALVGTIAIRARAAQFGVNHGRGENGGAR